MSSFLSFSHFIFYFLFFSHHHHHHHISHINSKQYYIITIRFSCILYKLETLPVVPSFIQSFVDMYQFFYPHYFGSNRLYYWTQRNAHYLANLPRKYIVCSHSTIFNDIECCCFSDCLWLLHVVWWIIFWCFE